MADKKGAKKYTINIDEDISKLLAVAAKERGIDSTKLINALLREGLTTETKLRTLIRANSRMRTQIDSLQQSFYTMFKTNELFYEWMFTLMANIPREEAEERRKKGKARFESFIGEFLRRNQESKFPIVMERILEEGKADEEDSDI